MINASYVVIDYMKAIAEEVLGEEVLNFHPGGWSPSSSDEVFATYKVLQSVDYSQPYLHRDSINITLYHPNFSKLQELTSLFLDDLNEENAADNPVLYSDGLIEGIRFHDVISIVTANDSGMFIEGTEHFTVRMYVAIQYVELFYLLTSFTRAHVVA